MIRCAAITCKYNKDFRCTLPDIEIGFDGKCNNYTLGLNLDGLTYNYTPTVTDKPGVWVHRERLIMSHTSGNYNRGTNVPGV